MPDSPRLAPCGDRALTVEFAQAIDDWVNARVHALDAALARAPPPGVQETMASYGALLVHYDPTLTSFAELAPLLQERARTLTIVPPRQTGWRIPVAYGSTYGFDLDAVAETLGLTPAEVVARHTDAHYHVHMIGFLPGFTYLGGLDPSIAMPRRPVPRAQVPAGSIVVGGIQTAIGSIEGPSGWHVIGRTPVRAFMPARDPAVFMMPGDRVILEAVPTAAFDRLARCAADGSLVAEPIL